MPPHPTVRPRGLRGRPALALAIVLGSGCGDVTLSIDAEARPGSDSGTDASTDEAESSTGASPDTGLDESDTTGEPAPEEPRCQRLDLLFVVDNTSANASVMEGLSQAAETLAELLTDPSRPWHEDFHVGYVPSQSTGPLAECRVSGALSARPDDAHRPCSTAEGMGWVSAADEEPSSVLECLAGLSETSEQPLLLAQASGRGLGTPIARDPNGDAVVAQCNAGFRRADAMGVLVIVGSNDDLGSPGDSSTWSQVSMSDEDSQLIVAMVPDSEPGLGCPGPAGQLLEWLFHEPGAAVLDWCESEDRTSRLLEEIETQLDARCGGGTR